MTACGPTWTLVRGIKLNRSEVKRLDLEGEKMIWVRVDLGGDRD